MPGDIPIEKVERMMYWDKEKQTTQKSHNIKVEFRATCLPSEMFVFYVRKTVTPFIPKPTICRKCLMYGHVAKICRSSTHKCVNCSEDTHTYTPDCDCQHCRRNCIAKCKHCNVDGHNVMQQSCPEQKKQTQIKTLMITKQLTFTEAKKITESGSQGTNNTQSYANITTLTTIINTLKEELQNMKKLNQALIVRLATAEKTIELINEKKTQQTLTIKTQLKLNQTRQKATPKRGN